PHDAGPPKVKGIQIGKAVALVLVVSREKKNLPTITGKRISELVPQRLHVAWRIKSVASEQERRRLFLAGGGDDLVEHAEAVIPLPWTCGEMQVRRMDQNCQKP